jgi:mRNA-degrading endonuclease YafQ of YafQ-DinJ toxin-antitoxin module
MRSLIWSGAFTRACKRTSKKYPEIKEPLYATLRGLQKDPFSPDLRTHCLKGRMSGLWACSVDYDFRIIFEFVKRVDQREDDLLLLAMGTHDDVY